MRSKGCLAGAVLFFFPFFFPIFPHFPPLSPPPFFKKKKTSGTFTQKIGQRGDVRLKSGDGEKKEEKGMEDKGKG